MNNCAKNKTYFVVGAKNICSSKCTNCRNDGFEIWLAHHFTLLEKYAGKDEVTCAAYELFDYCCVIICEAQFGFVQIHCK